MGLLFSSLWSRLFGNKEYKIVMVGLNNAGKTTILYKLHLGDVIETQPTIGSNVEEVVHRNIRFQVWDLGGQETLRKSWGTYYINTHAVILVVDSTDREHMPVVKRELSAITAHQDLGEAVLLVLANKQDLRGAATAEDIDARFGFRELCTTRQPYRVLPVSALKGDGIADGISWMVDTLKRSARTVARA
mmetsp:Transcript_17960/g.60156  ORF Transcript_17960/g.60156 Transcript_17960/m.60156 type:complete len:190 (-) Transcript_17960:1253-1822(-)